MSLDQKGKNPEGNKSTLIHCFWEGYPIHIHRRRENVAIHLWGFNPFQSDNNRDFQV